MERLGIPRILTDNDVLGALSKVTLEAIFWKNRVI
jgi:hypothetical protein